MSYLGTVDMNDANIKHYSLSSSTLTTVDIGWVPPSEQSLRVTINGVVQQGGSFSLSGSNLTLGGPLVATDDLEVIGIQSVGNIITPADNSVTTAKLADDAVTTVKINDDAVTLAKMAGGTDGNLITYDASGDPAYVATGAATNILTSNGAGAAPTFQAAAAGGLSYAQQWRLTTGLSCSNVDTYVYANWEKPESEDSPGVIGTDMVVDATTSATLSGAWTFPATGVWYVMWRLSSFGVTSGHSFTPKLWTTDDNGSNWYLAASTVESDYPGEYHFSAVDYLVSISDVTNDKVRVSGIVSANSSTIQGDTNTNKTVLTFIKLGD